VVSDARFRAACGGLSTLLPEALAATGAWCAAAPRDGKGADQRT